MSGMRKEYKMQKEYLTVKEAADFLGIAEGTLYNWVHYKKIQYIKIGKILRISKTHLENIIKKNTINPVRSAVLS